MHQRRGEAGQPVGRTFIAPDGEPKFIRFSSEVSGVRKLKLHLNCDVFVQAVQRKHKGEEQLAWTLLVVQRNNKKIQHALLAFDAANEMREPQ